MFRVNSLKAYVIGVFIALALVICAGWYFGGAERAKVFGIYAGGFLMGMLSMYIAVRVHCSKRPVA
jgi:hypothetical protein